MTFLLAALGTGLAAVVLSSGRRAIAGISLMMSAAVITGVGMALPGAAPSAGGEFRVAVVQGGPQRGQGLDQARAVLTAHADQSRALAANATVPFALVVWPESSTDLDPLIDPWAREQVTEAVEALAAPVIVGAVTAVPGDRENVHNKALVWSPSTGPGAAYAKQRLVPFGEYVPARALLERLSSRFAQVPRDVIPGTGVPVLQVGAIALGVLICYEVAFDGNVRDAIRGGATLLAVPANNATYRGTAQPSQQLMIARFRARETERAVLVASTTGVSAIVNADGSVEARLDDGAAGHLTGSVVPNLALTPSMRWGAVTGGGVALLGLLSVTAGARQQWRARV
jgi:apolipoprotein N-acyltransferase